MINLSDQIGKAWKFALLLIAVTAVFAAAAAHAAASASIPSRRARALARPSART